jgi:hypothetical protein
MKLILLTGASFFLTGCFLPEPPLSTDFKAVISSDWMYIYKTKKTMYRKTKNVLFLAADDNIQSGFKPILQDVFKTQDPPRLEDLVFWQYLGDMKNIYNTIIQIPFSNVKFESFYKSILYLESLKQPYDIILLTHGIPNNLSSGQGHFLSYKDLEKMQGQLKNLNLVMLQSCFGKSLSKDFLKIGAKYVLSYPDFNKNFFFFGFFLEYYYENASVETAFVLAKENFEFQMRRTIYDRIVKSIFRLQTEYKSKEELVSSMAMPELERSSEN